MPKRPIQLKHFNNRFGKIIDALEHTGLNYKQIEDVLIHTYREKRTQKIISFINMNLTQSQIADELGVSSMVVQKTLSDYYTKKMEIHNDI